MASLSLAIVSPAQAEHDDCCPWFALQVATLTPEARQLRDGETKAQLLRRVGARIRLFGASDKDVQVLPPE